MEQSRRGEPLCNVVLLGPVSESSSEQLLRGLQERFRLTAQQAKTLVRRAPVVVKKGITIEKAHSLVQHLEEIGARVRIERVHPGEQPEAPTRPESTFRATESPNGEETARESYCMWEDMENLGFLRAFFGTLGEVLFQPSRFFSRMPVDRGLVRPLVFALLMGVLGGLFGLLYQFLLMRYVGRLFSPEGVGDFQTAMMIGWAIGLPILTVIGLFIGSAILHLSLMIVRGNRKGFEATFRVIAYAMSTQIFGIIPLLGGLIGGIWALVVEIVGLRESHEISTGRAALAIFLPIIVIVGLVVVIVTMIVAPFFLRGFQEAISTF